MYRSILLAVCAFGIYACIYAGPQPEKHPGAFVLSLFGIMFLVGLMCINLKFNWRRVLNRINFRLMKFNERVWQRLDSRKQR